MTAEAASARPPWIKKIVILGVIAVGFVLAAVLFAPTPRLRHRVRKPIIQQDDGKAIAIYALEIRNTGGADSGPLDCNVRCPDLIPEKGMFVNPDHAAASNPKVRGNGFSIALKPLQAGKVFLVTFAAAWPDKNGAPDATIEGPGEVSEDRGGF